MIQSTPGPFFLPALRGFPNHRAARLIESALGNDAARELFCAAFFLHQLGRACEVKVLALPVIHIGKFRIHLRKKALFLDLVDCIAAFGNRRVLVLLVFLQHVAGIDEILVEVILVIIQVPVLEKLLEGFVTSKRLCTGELLVAEVMLAGIIDQFFQEICIDFTFDSRISQFLGISINKFLFLLLPKD